MKGFGVLLIIIGIAWGVIAFNMETTVEVNIKEFGVYSYNQKPERVNNMGLMDRRKTHLIGAAIAFVSGIILFGFGSTSGASSNSSNRKCPYCAEIVKIEAKICKHCTKELPVVEINASEQSAGQQIKILQLKHKNGDITDQEFMEARKDILSESTKG